MPSRPYLHPQDHPLVLDFLQSVRPPERRRDYPGPVDLEELLPLAELQARVRLWLDPDDQLAAFVLVDPFNNLWFECRPSEIAEIGVELVEFGAECLRSELAEGETGALETNCAENNPARRELLLALGFAPLPEATLRLARSLTEPFPAPSLPPGFSIRPLNGETEVEAAAELHRAAFGTGYMTVENRLALMQTSVYRPEMDLVVVAPDGRLAAYTLCSISAEGSEPGGSIDPVATHPDYQRQGLARALLLTGMQLLKERGLETARLGTSSENPAMQKTAASVGFQVESQTTWFRREVSG